MTDQPWRIICSLYKTLVSKTFPREFRGIFELKKVCITQNKKKTSLACCNRVLWKALRKEDVVSFGFSKKKLFGTRPPLLNKPMDFITKLLEKNSSKIVLSNVLPASRYRDYALRFHWCMYIFYWIQYKF